MTTPPPIHTHAVILSTGDELMTGQLQDSNARWLSEQLVNVGILVSAHAAVGDDLSDLIAAIQHSAARAPLIIMSGGLGPTDGDLTREAICRATSDLLVLDPASRVDLADKLTRRGREVTPRQERQAFRPSRAAAIPNPFGTAPGLHATITSEGDWKTTDILCLPGPPGELQPMFTRDILPLLRPPADRLVLTRLLHVIAIPEADCVQRLGDLTKRDRVPLVGITASGGVLTIRIRYEASEPNTDSGRAVAAARINAIETDIRCILGDHVLPGSGTGDESGPAHLAAHTIRALRASPDAPRTLAVVESCTGGMLGEMLTAISGSSSVFLGGFITYSNTLKQRLGVRAETLHRVGAVSPETAREMAFCGLRESTADYCVSITGIAGPDGGSQAKPVGTVHIALAAKSSDGEHTVDSRHFLFTGGREDIRRRACVSALAMLHFNLRAHPPGTPRLLWELT